MSAAMVVRFLSTMNVSAETLERVRAENISGKVLAALSNDIQNGLQCLGITDPVARARIRVECVSGPPRRGNGNGNRDPAESAGRLDSPLGPNPDEAPDKAKAAALATAAAAVQARRSDAAAVQARLSEAAIPQRTKPETKPPKPAEAAAPPIDPPRDPVKAGWAAAKKVADRLAKQVNVQVGYTEL
jgi:hypothetical protein